MSETHDQPAGPAHAAPSDDAHDPAGTDPAAATPPDVAGHAHDDTEHGHDDSALAGGHEGHANLAEPLGPVDWRMWGAGLLGVVAGLAVSVCMALATGLLMVA